MLNADSTGKCELGLVCTSRANVRGTFLLQQQSSRRQGEGQTIHLPVHAAHHGASMHVDVARRTARPGKSVDGIESRRRHVGW